VKIDDFKRLKGMMDRTTSENDNEALVALRAANRLLTRENLTWTRVLDRSVNIAVPFESRSTAEGKTDNEEMEALFDVALSKTRPGGFQDTLQSIYDQWQTHGRISARQRQVVEEAADYNVGLR
jgi:hypothetical protein